MAVRPLETLIESQETWFLSKEIRGYKGGTLKPWGDNPNGIRILCITYNLAGQSGPERLE